MQGLQIRTVLALLSGTREYFRHALQQFGLPLRNLIRMYIEPLRQLGQGWSPLTAARAILALKGR